MSDYYDKVVVRAREASDLRPVIDRRFPLEELVAAFSSTRRANDTFGGLR